MLVSFLWLWQIARDSKLIKEESFILAPSFRGFIPWPVGLVAFGPVVKQYIMVRVCDSRGLLTSWWPGSKRKREEDTGLSIALSRAHLPWPNFLPLGLTSQKFFHIPVISQAGHQAFTIGPLRTTPDPNYSIYWAFPMSQSFSQILHTFPLIESYWLYEVGVTR
jgi:hypothetical protein